MGNWDKAPWLMGGGVKHSVEITRLLSFVGFGGNEGIVKPTDLQVKQAGAPDATVRIQPGACGVLNKHGSYEAFAARLPVIDTLAVPATPGGGGRTDLVVARIKNPFYAGSPWPTPSPADITAENYEFIDSFLISGMSGPTPGQHPTLTQVRNALAGLDAIPLASIARAASISTVAQSAIKDWRTLVMQQESQIMRVVEMAATVTVDTATYEDIATVTVDVPVWATNMSLLATLGNATYTAPQSKGGLRFRLAGSADTAATAFDESSASGTAAATLMAANDRTPLPANTAGTSMTVTLQGAKQTGTNLVINQYSAVAFQIAFHAIPQVT